MKIVIGLRHTVAHNTGDMPHMLEMVRLADQKGIYGLELSDHLVFAEVVDGKYPYGAASINKKSYFYEPMTLLAAYAAITKRLRFSTHIMVAPARSAIFLAKQIATVDLVANGRLDVGFGAGWQKEEMELTPGVPFEGRFGYMDEQVGACRALWAGGPAHFHGKHINFDNLYAYPLPVQGANVPIFYGMKPSERNFARMAAHADGWMAPPIVHSPETLKPHLDQLKAAWEKQGRDPATLRVSLMPKPVKHNESDKYADIDATLDQLPSLEKAGVDHVRIYPFQYTDSDGYEAWLDKVAAAQK